MSLTNFVKEMLGIPSRPLGVRSDFPVTAPQLERLAAIEGFDLSNIKIQLVRRKKIASHRVDEAIYEFRRYMGIYAIDGLEQSVSMFSDSVDEVWHMLIQHTRLYQEFCDAAFGQFLHHNPFEDGDPNPIASWTHFEARYQAIYGTLRRIWMQGKPYIPSPSKARSRSSNSSSDRNSGGGDGGFFSFFSSCGGDGGSSSSCGGGDGGGSGCGGGGD